MRKVGNDIALTLADCEKSGMTLNIWENILKRGQCVSITKGGNGRVAEVSYNSLPEKWKTALKGVYGDVWQYVDGLVLQNALESRLQGVKSEVKEGLEQYRTTLGVGLPTKVIDQYKRDSQWLDLMLEAKRMPLRKCKETFTATYSEILIYISSNAARMDLGLPTTRVRLTQKVIKYSNDGYKALISKKYGNENSLKLCDAAKDWLIAKYSSERLRIPELAHQFSIECKKRGWEVVSETRIFQVLMLPENKQKWSLGRYGDKTWARDYEHTFSGSAASCREAMWCSDGTKLNFFYQSAEADKVADQDMYIVVDAYSEVILGWEIGGENHLTQFKAYKKALEFSGNKPYQVLYDKQGGHIGKAMQPFFDKLAKVHFPGIAYNSKGKPVESVIGRFQTQIMSKYWFFTGQNITAKSDESRTRLDYIHKNRALLPTLEEVIALIDLSIKTWNEAKHPRMNCSRIESYTTSSNPKSEKVDYLDMIELFWLTTDREITYRKEGLTLTLGQQEYKYEVIENGLPSLEFLTKYTMARFRVKYDPDDMSMIRLYLQEGDDLRYVATADSKRLVHRAVQDLEDGERGYIDQVISLRKSQKQFNKAAIEQAVKNSGYDVNTAILNQHVAGKKEAILSIMDELVDIGVMEAPVKRAAKRGYGSSGGTGKRLE